MRKKNYKGRCEKRLINKCRLHCKTYDAIQAAYVEMLDKDPSVVEIQCNVPRATGRFTRKGLQVNGLRYRHDAYTESFLKGGEALVAYNPDDVTQVWLVEKGCYIQFTLIESRFKGKCLDDVQGIQKASRKIVNDSASDSLQAQIDLAKHIQMIAAQTQHSDTQVKNIRSTRKREQYRTHRDYAKENAHE